MTVTYAAEVATSSFSCFLKLLLRWRGSVYKLLWLDVIVFGVLYYTLSFIYRFALNDDQKRVFEKVAQYCDTFNSLIPVAFVMGFYVSIVVDRWWQQFNSIPWPDRMAMFVTANVHGHDERGRLMRRTLMRYLCLSFVITMSSISPPVKKRFPNFKTMTIAGFMQENEEEIIEKVPTDYNKYFVPLAWATSLVARARKEGRIKDDFAVKTLIDEINDFRGKLGGLFNFDQYNVPLVYTQVVTLAVYTFFLSCLMGRQFLERGHTADMYVPVFTFLQFLFYMGWLKVAETLVNPFGEDDDDFDVNSLVDRNLKVSYLYVDEMHDAGHPELIKDQYWDEVDFALPYPTEEPFLGSAMNIEIPVKTPNVGTLNSVPELPGDIESTSPGSRHSFRRQNSRPAAGSKIGSFFAGFRPKGSRRSVNTEQDPFPNRHSYKKRNENSICSADSSLFPDLDHDAEIFTMDDVSFQGDLQYDEVGDRKRELLLPRASASDKRTTNSVKRSPGGGLSPRTTRSNPGNSNPGNSYHGNRVPRSTSQDSHDTLADSQGALHTIAERSFIGASPSTAGASSHTPGTHTPGTHTPGTQTPGTHTPETHTPTPRAVTPTTPTSRREFASTPRAVSPTSPPSPTSFVTPSVTFSSRSPRSKFFSVPGGQDSSPGADPGTPPRRADPGSTTGEQSGTSPTR